MDATVKVCALEELQRDGVKTVGAEGRVIAVFWDRDGVFALDNRCPHMGFPLNRGTVDQGVLTCHWHHARFDVASGCTFDLFADDVPRFAAEVRDGFVWVDPHPMHGDPLQRWLRKLDEGLEHQVNLVLAKAVIGLDELGGTIDLLEKAALFGIRNRADGWSPGLSSLTAIANALPALRPEDRRLALFKGIIRVQVDTAENPPNFDIEPLSTTDMAAADALRWFRRFIEVRSEEAAERTLRTAIKAAHPQEAIAEMIFAACTDHLARSTGHVLDFANKAFELLDHIGWRYADEVLPSLIHPLAHSSRSEERSQWRAPKDVASMLFEVYERLDAAIDEGAGRLADWTGHADLAETILTAEPEELLARMEDAVRAGVPLSDLSSSVVYAGARRFVHFPTSNEIVDWDDVHNTFSYCNAVDRAIRRAPSKLLARGIFDAAISVYLDRFLNVPRRPIPEATGRAPDPQEYLAIFNRHGSVEEAGQATMELVAAGRRDEVIALLGQAIMREDSSFHEFQALDALVMLRRVFGDTPSWDHVAVGVARYMASLFPTQRVSLQTYEIAERLHRGEHLYGEDFEV